jgi:hypothetical protein
MGDSKRDRLERWLPPLGPMRRALSLGSTESAQLPVTLAVPEWLVKQNRGLI